MLVAILGGLGTDELFRQFQENTANRTGFTANFEQVRHVSLFMDELRAEGKCWFEKPDKLRWEITSPYQSIMIYNDGEMGRFELRDGEWREMDTGAKDMMGAVLGQISAWMEGDFEQASQMYGITLREEENPVVVLEPANQELRDLIHSIELTIDRRVWGITSVKIRENEGDYVMIQFTGQIDNPKIDPRIFDPDHPTTSHE